MNKRLLAIVCTLFISLVAASFVSAATSSESSLNGCKVNSSNISSMPSSLDYQLTTVGNYQYCMYGSYDDCGMVCLLNGVYNTTNWIFIVLMAVAALMIIFGAVMFTTSQGDPEKTTKARDLILYAAVGIAVALFARAVPAVVKMIVGA